MDLITIPSRLQSFEPDPRCLDPASSVKTLYAARKALTTLRGLQEAFSNSITSVDSYPYFLTWYASLHIQVQRVYADTLIHLQDYASLSTIALFRTILQRCGNIGSKRF
jgi:hypothetical protein